MAIQPNLKKRLRRYGTKNIDPSVDLRSVHRKYNGKCQDCDTPTAFIHPPQPHSASIEHIIPLSAGGSHPWDNVELLCHKCNTARNSKMVNGRKQWKFRIFGFMIIVVKD